MKATLSLHPSYVVGKVDDRLFGSFVEHAGRSVYHGIYEPEHPTADEEGFRGDVLEMVKELDVPIVRYPGGNFVSGYHWEDGTGPKENRPHRPSLSWGLLETNEVGIDEFQSWCKKANTEVMMAVNLGTRGPEDARNLVEYCNFQGNTYYSDMRRKNGFEEPFGIKVWCLGNEMAGSWQMGAKTAAEYGRIAAETAKLMKWVDPSIELTVSGTTGFRLCGDWELEILRHTYRYVDYLSIHAYYGNYSNDTAQFLACSLDMDRYIEAACAICDTVKKTLNSDKTLYLSFDEWNVWFHSTDFKPKEKWPVTWHQLEDIYTFEDALVVGCLLMTLMKHCDRVKIACLAQLVNVIAPIMTENGGKAWVQTIFYPFMHASAYGRGVVLDGRLDCPTYAAGDFPEVPYLETCSVQLEDGSMTVFAVNRSLEEDIEFTCDLSVFGITEVQEHIYMTNDDLKCTNTADAPEAVVPSSGGTAVVESGVLTAKLGKHSWNVIRIR